MPTKYSVGFSFNNTGSRIVLIRKQRPKWQAGKLNGVGGHVEPGESFRQCMVREFREETGVETEPYSWQDFGVLRNPAATVTMFMRFNDDAYNVQTMTDEAVEVWDVKDLQKEPDSGLMTNLRWIIPSAVDKWEHNSGLFIEAKL